MENKCCPVCEGSSLTSVLKLERLPVAINAQTRPEDATRVAKGDINLVVCESCGHLFNAVFDSSKFGYDESYENSLHYSAHFREFARGLAERLVADHELAGAMVAEAGAGPGHFLAMLCDAGVGEAYGFDPSYDPGRLEAKKHKSVKLTQGLFPSDGSLKAKFVFSQHVLEHLSSPVTLLKELAASVSDTKGGAVYSEVPNGKTMLNRCALWDLIYEHYSYFTATSLVYAAQRAGLSCIQVSEIYDDQFLALDSGVCEPSDKLPELAEVEAIVQSAIEFGAEARRNIDRAQQELAQYRDLGPVALWGAGSKGMTYMNLIAAGGMIDAVVDVNPRKEGFGIPGVDAVIRSPEALRSVKPSTVLIANPVYKSEIERLLGALDLSVDVRPLWA